MYAVLARQLEKLYGDMIMVGAKLKPHSEGRMSRVTFLLPIDEALHTAFTGSLFQLAISLMGLVKSK